MPMLTAAATTTTTTTTELTLKPSVRHRLLTSLRTYVGLKKQRDAADLAMVNSRTIVEQQLHEIGETSVSLEGFKATIIAGFTKKLDQMKLKKLLVAAGVPMTKIDAAFDAATSDVPKKTYVKISSPNERTSEDDE